MGGSEPGLKAGSSGSPGFDLARRSGAAHDEILWLRVSGGQALNTGPLVATIGADHDRRLLTPRPASDRSRRRIVFRVADIDREIRGAPTVSAESPDHRNPHHRPDTIR